MADRSPHIDHYIDHSECSSGRRKSSDDSWRTSVWFTRILLIVVLNWCCMHVVRRGTLRSIWTYNYISWRSFLIHDELHVRSPHIDHLRSIDHPDESESGKTFSQLLASGLTGRSVSSCRHVSSSTIRSRIYLMRMMHDLHLKRSGELVCHLEVDDVTIHLWWCRRCQLTSSLSFMAPMVVSCKISPPSRFSR